MIFHKALANLWSHVFRSASTPARWDSMKIVVGLGNPGQRYLLTRHNVGFMVIEELAKRWGAENWRSSRHEAHIVQTEKDGQRVLLVAPQTWMNASGRSVSRVLKYYQVDSENLLVICDDLSLPLGKLRLRPQGSSGGHNGLKDIISAVGSEFSRLRIGIGQVPTERETADWVLSRFGNGEMTAVLESLQKATLVVETWIDEGAEVAMNRYN